MIDVSDRAGATVHIVQFFAYNHLREPLAQVSAVFERTAGTLLSMLEDSPELTVALRKLLEAKDAAVRAALLGSDD